MPYRDPEKRREADRERRRRERAGAAKVVEGTEKNMSAPLPDGPTVAQLTGVIAGEINQVRASKSETLARARTVGYLAGVLLKALEVGEVERRLDELEAKVGQGRMPLVLSGE